MIDIDDAAVAVLAAGDDHHARAGGVNRRAAVGHQIDALVPLAAAVVERVAADAVARAELAIDRAHGEDRGGGGEGGAQRGGGTAAGQRQGDAGGPLNLVAVRDPEGRAELPPRLGRRHHESGAELSRRSQRRRCADVDLSGRGGVRGAGRGAADRGPAAAICVGGSGARDRQRERCGECAGETHSRGILSTATRSVKAFQVRVGVGNCPHGEHRRSLTTWPPVAGNSTCHWPAQEAFTERSGTPAEMNQRLQRASVIGVTGFAGRSAARAGTQRPPGLDVNCAPWFRMPPCPCGESRRLDWEPVWRSRRRCC